MLHTPTIKLIPLCLTLTSCTGLCAPTGTYELFPEDMSNDVPDMRIQDMRGSKDASSERDMKEMVTLDLGKTDQGGRDLGDKCIPTTTSDDEDWLCDGIDNDCDGEKDEICCQSMKIQSIQLDQKILNLEITPSKSKDNPEDWIVEYTSKNNSKILKINNTPPKIITTNYIGADQNCEPYTPAIPINTNKSIFLTQCQSQKTKTLNFEFNDSTFNNINPNLDILRDKPQLNNAIHTNISTTSKDNEIWVSTLDQLPNNQSILTSCILDLTTTQDDIDQQGFSCVEKQQQSIPSLQTLGKIKATNNQKNKIHYTATYGDDGKIYYMHPDTPPVAQFPAFIHNEPALLLDISNNKSTIFAIASTKEPPRNTLNLYTVSFGQEITQAPVELLPRNSLNQWPALTEIDRDGVKGAEQVALVWQQDKRLMLAIFDPYNPGTITPKAITPEYPTATNIISSIASDDKGLGVAWTVEGETPQKIYYQAISFNGDFICPAP